MWEDLLAESKKHGFQIRSIIISDAAWQGVSGQINADKLGNDREFPPSPWPLFPPTRYPPLRVAH